MTEITKEDVFKRDGWQCRNCKSRENLQAHHLIYRSQGGPDEIWNEITLCFQCHEAEHHKYLLIIVLPESTEDNVVTKFVWLHGWRPK